jgi:osmotically-inducible protein OsmY
MTTSKLALGLALVCSPGMIVRAQNRPTKPDNTKVNAFDRIKQEPTADQQKENKSDREIAQEIRKAIVADKSLSTYAHNVKVVAENGSVTLKGPVHSEDEKKAIEAKAAEVAGQHAVNSKISIVPAKSKKSE